MVCRAGRWRKDGGVVTHCDSLETEFACCWLWRYRPSQNSGCSCLFTSLTPHFFLPFSSFSSFFYIFSFGFFFLLFYFYVGMGSISREGEGWEGEAFIIFLFPDLFSFFLFICYFCLREGSIERVEHWEGWSLACVCVCVSVCLCVVCV